MMYPTMRYRKQAFGSLNRQLGTLFRLELPNDRCKSHINILLRKELHPLFSSYITLKIYKPSNITLMPPHHEVQASSQGLLASVPLQPSSELVALSFPRKHRLRIATSLNNV